MAVASLTSTMSPSQKISPYHSQSHDSLEGEKEEQGRKEKEQKREEGDEGDSLDDGGGTPAASPSVCPQSVSASRPHSPP